MKVNLRTTGVAVGLGLAVDVGLGLTVAVALAVGVRLGLAVMVALGVGLRVPVGLGVIHQGVAVLVVTGGVLLLHALVAPAASAAR